MFLDEFRHHSEGVRLASQHLESSTPEVHFWYTGNTKAYLCSSAESTIRDFSAVQLQASVLRCVRKLDAYSMHIRYC